MIASKVRMSISEPARQIPEMSIQPIIHHLNGWLGSGHDKRLDELTPVLGNLLERKTAIVEHVRASLQFLGITRVDVEQR